MSPPPPAPPAPPIHAPKKHHRHHHQYHMVNQEEVWCPPTTATTIITTKKSSSTKTVVCISACLSILMFLLGLFLGAFVHAVVYPDGGSPMSSLLVDGVGFGNDSVVIEGVYDEIITNEKLIQSTTTSENEEEQEEAPTESETTSPTRESPSESLLEDHRECMNMTWYSSRLPRWFQPIEYRIQLHPNLTTNRVNSKVVIEVMTVEKTNQLILNAEDLKIGKFEIRRKKKNQILEAEFTDCKLMTQWSWKFEKHVKTGEKLEIHIEYESELKPDLQGLYLSTHASTNGTRQKSAATQFEPTFARKMLPCFDEPDFKAHFIVSIIRDAHHIARSNMPMKESTWIEETGMYEDVFEKSVKMSTYLLAVAVLDNYAYVRRLTRRTRKPIEVRLYAPADAIQGQSEFGLDTSVRALEFFETYFNISYPLEKIDLLALDDFSEGAMENWGLVTFRDSALLFDEKKASCVAKEHIALIICHEIAHQWFGNLVTMAWWNEVYLNEGFANYMEYKCVDELFPTWNIMTRFYAENVAFSQEPDGLLTTRAIEADDSDNIMNLFDAINYHKAAAIIHMIAELAGQQNFQKALIEYLDKFAYANAKGVELWKIVEKHANHLSGAIDIPTLAHAYTSQAGYPLINFEGRENEVVIHNQTRFTFHEAQLEVAQQEIWPIPISYRLEGDETVRTHWLLPNRSDDTWQIASGNDSWVIVNTGGVGYFKVQYDERMYTRLTRQLKTNHSQIAAIDRAMLLVDTFDLTRTSRLSIDVYLNLVEYAEVEQDKMTWTIINKHLQTIESLIDDTSHIGTFRDFHRSLLLPLYESFSWHQQPDTPMRKGLQIETFQAACRLSIIDCTNQAHKLYRNQWQKKSHLKNPEFSGIVLEEGIRRDGEGAWEQIWKSYNATKSPAERNSIINSLASVKDSKLINKLLNFCLDGQIKLNLIPRVFSALSQHSTGRNAAWRFFKLNFDKFHELMGSGSTLLSTCIRCLAEPLSTQQDLDELKVFLKEKQLEEEGQMKMEQTYEQVELNIQWRRLNEKKFGEWLNNWDEKRTRFND